MANVRFKLRRSSTYNGAINAIPASVGELVSISTNSNNYVSRVGHKLYIGTGTETSGQASAFESIGGSYYTQLLDGVAGVVEPLAAIITDGNNRIDSLEISSAGSIALNNTANTARISIKSPGNLAASYTLTLPASAGTSGQYLSTDGTGVLSWNTVSNNSINIDDNTISAYNITDGTTNYFTINTNTGAKLTTIGTTLSVSNGILSTAATTANLFNTTATTVNFAGAATDLNIGSSTGTTTVNNNLVVSGSFTVNGDTVINNTVTLSIQDPIITQGLVNGVAPTSATTFDLGSKYSYYDTSARSSAIFWQKSSGKFVLASNVTESSNVFTVAVPTSTVNEYSTLNLGSLQITDFACAVGGVAESIISYKTINGVAGRHLENLICDCGVF